MPKMIMQFKKSILTHQETINFQLPMVVSNRNPFCCW